MQCNTNINFDDATASIGLLRSVAEFFVSLKDSNQIIEECKNVVTKWKNYADARGAPARETKIMQSAFEHEEVYN